MMVFLTMTPAIVEALQEVQSLGEEQSTIKGTNTASGQIGGECDEAHASTTSGSTTNKDSSFQEPLLSDPQLGNPISHGQVIDLWKRLKATGSFPRSLDILLRGARVYTPPPEPKHEPVRQEKRSLAFY